MRDTALVLRGGAGRGAVGIDYGRFDALECSDAPGSSSAEDGSGGDEGFRARVEAIRGRPDEQEGGGQRDAQRGRKGEPLIRKEQPKDIADSGQDPGPMKNDPGGGGRNEEQGGGGGEREGYGRAREASANKRGAGETPGVAEDLDAARVAKKVRAQPGSAQNATAAAPSGRSSPQDGREVQGGEAEGGKNASGASQGGSAVVGGGAGRPEREPNATRPARQPNVTLTNEALKSSTQRRKYVDDVSGEVVCEWDQSYEDVNVWVTLPASAKASDVALVLRPSFLSLSILNMTVLEGKLSKPVRSPPESFWLLEEREVHLVLVKAKAGAVWTSLLYNTKPISDAEASKVEADLELEKMRTDTPHLFINRDTDTLPGSANYGEMLRAAGCREGDEDIFAAMRHQQEI